MRRWALAFALLTATVSISAQVSPARLRFVLTSGSGEAPCTSTISSGTSIATSLGSVASGGTLCLNAGTYTFNATVTKTSATTIRPADGVARSSVTVTAIQLNSSAYLRFYNVTTGTGTHDIGSGARHVQLASIDFKGPICVNTASAMDVLIDGSLFNGLSEACNEGRLAVKGGGSNNGIVISNNHFSGGNSDAIQLTGSADGTTIGPGNVFEDINSCGAVHCDAIQTYFATNTTITGNYFGGNMAGGHIAEFDCNGSPMFISNNVFKDTGAAQVDIGMSGADGDTLIHNTFGPSVTVSIYGGNPGSCTNTNMTIRDNVMRGSCSIANGSSNTISYNVVAGGGGCVGTNGISGSATFTGGTNPTTWLGWALTAGSLGHLAGSDGLDMGALTFGTP